MLDITCESSACRTVVADMYLKSLTKLGFQLLINICVRLFFQWRLDYNALKCR